MTKLLISALLFTFAMLLSLDLRAVAVAATPTPEPVAPCEHVATADTIKIYFCDDIDLFVNDLGFMAFEP